MQDGGRLELVVVLLLMELAIVARQLLRRGQRRGQRLAFPLAAGGEAPPGTPGV